MAQKAQELEELKAQLEAERENVLRTKEQDNKKEKLQM